MLEMLIEEREYVAVFFMGDECKGEESEMDQDTSAKEEDFETADCQEILAELAGIFDELGDIGILTVVTDQKEVASENGEQYKKDSLGAFQPHRGSISILNMLQIQS